MENTYLWNEAGLLWVRQIESNLRQNPTRLALASAKAVLIRAGKTPAKNVVELVQQLSHLCLQIELHLRPPVASAHQAAK